MVAARGGSGVTTEALQLCERAAKSATTPRDEAHALAATGIVLLRSGDAAAAREKLAEAQALDANSEVAVDLQRLLSKITQC